MNRTVLLGALLVAAGPALAQQPETLPPPATAGIQACLRPQYPPVALLREEEGTTTLLFMVPAGGAAPELRLIRSSGSRTLDDAALRTAGTCLGKPEVRADLAPDRWYRQSIQWVLQ